MHQTTERHLFVTGLTLMICLFFMGSAKAWESNIVYCDTNGNLTYQADANGNRIPDFSYAGYRNGEVALPSFTTQVTLSPIAGDNTAHIQAAIDSVEAMTLSNGERGAVLLNAGTYQVNGTLTIQASGVVLRGSGDGSSPSTNTILHRTDKNNGTSVIIIGNGGETRWQGEVASTRTDITSNLVQVGDNSFDVANASAYSVGDNIVIFHPCSQGWIDAVDGGGTVNDGDWAVGDSPIVYTRYITDISGNTITIDVPVFNHLDRTLSQSYIYKHDSTGFLSECGLEDFRVEIDTNGSTAEDQAYDAILYEEVEDCWATNLTANHFVRSGILLKTASRVTIESCRMLDPHSIITGSRRYNFNIQYGQLNLVKDCEASEARHAYVCNGEAWDSGNVFLNSTAASSHTSSEAHRQWGHGNLWDGHTETSSSNTRLLGLYNRGDWGTKHGWSSAHSVAWRCDVENGSIVVQKPPTAQNYAIGCDGGGGVTGNGPWPGSAGHIEGTGNGATLEPQSLYLAQLDERINGSYCDTTGTSTTLNPTDDAYVQLGNGNTNYGSHAQLWAKYASSGSSVNRESFLQFDLSSLSGTVTSATLELYVDDDGGGSMSNTLHLVNDDTWDESTLTWNNKPSNIGAQIGSAWAPATGIWVRVDVTAQVSTELSGDGTLSLQIQSSTNGIVRYASKDNGTSANHPKLIVETQPANTTYAPSGDAYVKLGDGNTNYGTDDQLWVKYAGSGSSVNREAFLEFDLSTMPSNIASATLELYVDNDGGGTQSNTLHVVNDDTWSESTITWNNKPSNIGSQIGTAWTPTTGTLVQIDITHEVIAEKGGDGTLSLQIQSSTNGIVRYASKESATTENQPRIEITTGGTHTRRLADDFSGGSGDFTVISGGTWSVSSNQYRLSSAASANPLGNISIHNTNVPSDFTLTATASVDSGTDWDDFAIVFNYQNASNYYFAILNEQNNSTTSGIFKVQSGSSSQIADITNLISGGVTYSLRIEKTGSSISVYRDGTLQAQTTDATFSGGQVGFASYNNNCTFDNLLVTGPASASKPVVFSLNEQTDSPEFALGHNHPNPFNPETVIAYSVGDVQHIAITIYNVLGQTVQTLINAPHAPGNYRVRWNGKNHLGQAVASGVYFYRMKAERFDQTHRMLLLK